MAKNLNIAMVGGTFLIPVKVDTVAREAKSNLHEYHAADMGAGGRKKYCKACDKEITDADIVKGIEITKGTVVTFTKEELASLPLATTKNIEVDRFVEAGEINPLLMETDYYVSPRDGSDNAFNLLAEGLRKLKKVAVGKVAIAQRENLCVIRPIGGKVVMSTMYWNEEMKQAPQVPKSEITEVQLDLITQVIGKFSKPFNHADYSDQYLNALRDMAQKKMNGEAVTVIAERQPQQNLEDALRALVNK